MKRRATQALNPKPPKNNQGELRAAMKFVCSRVPNCRNEDPNGNPCPSKGQEEEHVAKVYPFTVSFPRYASWRIYVRLLLYQLKSCSNCKAAADAFPVSTLPKVHMMPNGKVVIFKGLTKSGHDHKPDFSRSGATDGSSEEMCSNNMLMSAYDEQTTHHHQSLSTLLEPSIEEYDMVSIDPNCPRHGRYSLTTWLQKEGAKVVGTKSRAICQIYPKTKKSQNYHIRRIKQVQKRDETNKSISSNFSKCMLDKIVIEKPSRVEVPSTLKKHNNENLEFNVLKQIELNTTTNSSLLFQKQPNILSTYSHQNNSVLRRKQKINSKVQMAHLNRKKQFNVEQVLLESNNNKRSVEITFVEREKCEALFGKDLLPISNKGLDKDACKCPKTYASQYRRMCCVKGLNYSNCFNSCNEVVEGNSKNIQHGAALEITIESNISFAPQECVYEENDKSSNGTTIKLRGDDLQSTSTIPIEFTREEQLMACNRFEMKELEQVEQQLEWAEHENDKLANETQIDLVGNEPSTCTPMRFMIEEHEMAHDMIAIEEVQQIGRFKSVQYENESLVNKTRIRLVDESRKCAPIGFSVDEHQILSDICNLKELKQSRQQLECVQHDMDNLVDETSSCTLTRFTIEEQQMASSIFDMKELEKTQQRLEKIVDTARSLQLGLNNHLHCDDSRIEKVYLSKVHVPQRSEAQEWLSNIAIERATSKISRTCQGNRVRQLVQAFESIN